MSPKDGKSSVFSEKTKPEPKRREERAPREKAGPAGKRGERKPARPLAELNARLAKEAARGRGSKLSLRQRIAAAMPLLGFLGVREIGLGVVLTGAITLMWIWHRYFVWGLVVVAIGLYIMRYGESWVKGE